ncbi:MAG: 16S rRNA (adenine(1518)-N(6)/adenine(1519)-N(6))-dimethyltransferase RsmA [Bacteroidia bacterium]|nr:16S rRNA (adenine(1518)-N(6)/adenine(1519)-N(6))-dimethyltransferase RsmA [Bacteroidia bacterium]
MPRYDQHFLCSEAYAQRIVAAVKPQPDEITLEIGPGRGALTKYLLLRDQPLIAVEIDKRCLEELQKLPAAEKAHWVHGDFRQLALSAERSYFLVSNLPYSLTGPALFWILERRWQVREGILMLQAEVAKRLYASEGSRDFTRLTVLFRSVYAVERLFRVPPGAFCPPPRVRSEVIRFLRRADVWEPWESFAAFVRVAFRQPRQKLAKNLRPLSLPLPPEWSDKRPHQLSLSVYYTLWQIYKDAQGTI